MKYDKKYLGKLKSNYYNAKALYEFIVQTDEEIQRKVLLTHPFYKEESMRDGGSMEENRIYEPSETYMMDLDNDFPQFLDLVYPEYVKAGIANNKGKEYIPEADSRSLMLQAEKQLVEYGIAIIPDEYAAEKEILLKNVKYRDKILSIVLCLESEDIQSYIEA